MRAVRSSEFVGFRLLHGTVATVLLLCCAGQVCAGDLDKIYVAADIGTVTYANMTKFPNPKSFRVSIGKHFTPMVSSEVCFIKFGDSTSISPSSGGTDKLSASGLQLFAVGSLPFDEKIELFGKIGVSFNRAGGSNNDTTSADKSHTALAFGVGQQYRFTPQIALRLQYEDFGAFESTSNPMKVTVFSMGIVYDL